MAVRKDFVNKNKKEEEENEETDGQKEILLGGG